MAEDLELYSWQKQEGFLTFIASRLLVGDTLAFCRIVIRGFFLEVKRPEHEADHSPSPNTLN
jgi:hypothetical protein